MPAVAFFDSPCPLMVRTISGRYQTSFLRPEPGNPARRNLMHAEKPTQPRVPGCYHATVATRLGAGSDPIAGCSVRQTIPEAEHQG
jgi:hypothetical protein